MSLTQSRLRDNEAELIKSVCSGDREAFYELVRPYERLVYVTAISISRSPSDKAQRSIARHNGRVHSQRQLVTLYSLGGTVSQRKTQESAEGSTD
jgi:hypothetical protein